MYPNLRSFPGISVLQSLYTMITQFLKFLFSLKFRRHFKIKQKLGEGGFGKVYLVTRKADSKLLAAKKLDKSKVRHMAQTKSDQLLPLEIYCLNGLRHENIVKVHGYIETSYSWFIMMEYCENSTDLFDYIKREGALSEEMSRDIFVQVYSAISYCLSVGVDHRDIKDENILVDTLTLKVKLVDFGSASLFKRNSPYTHARGTSIFLPPEFFRFGSYLPLNATSWAFGCLIYKMVMGYHPFVDRMEIASYTPRMTGVGTFGRDIVRHSLEKDPAKRIQFEKLGDHPWCSADLREIRI